MYAYVYIRITSKYEIVHESRIENFRFERLGIQSKEFASKSFLLLPELGKIKQSCQVLVIENTEEKLTALITKKRAHVPKVLDNDVPDNTSESSVISQTAKKDLKASAALKKNAAKQTSSAILKSHRQKSGPSSATTEKQNDDNDSDESENTFNQENNLTLSDLEDEEEPQPTDEVSELIRKNKMLKEALVKQKTENKRILSIGRKIEENYVNLKDFVENGPKQPKEELVARNQEAEERKKKHPTKNNEPATEKESNDMNVFPPIICTKSGYKARADAVDTAYTKVEPSKFYAHMCYAAWGYQELSTRCVKKTKSAGKSKKNGVVIDNSSKLKVLTPKKKRTVLKHYKHFLDHYQYNPFLYNLHMQRVNKYAHRAITNAQIHLVFNENDEEEDLAEGDVEFLEL